MGTQEPIITARIDTEAQTSAFARGLATRLGEGDTVLLTGPVGAGKTTLARALISDVLNRAGQRDEVPSPSYTLVQTYRPGAFEIWHVDLYRLADVGELTELGLEEAFGQALCLIEWADRLGGLRPDDALDLHLAPVANAPSARQITLSGSPRWAWVADLLTGATAR